MIDWNAIRAEFPALSRWTVLNAASFGQLPTRATAATAQHYAHRDELACADFIKWFDDMDVLRESIGKLVCCQPDDVAFVPNASAGLSILMSGLDWKPGDRVLTLDDEFPNQLYAANGVVCSWDRFYESIDERTRLVVLSTVNYNTGFVPPLAEIAAFLRPRGVLLYVDGSQSVGALDFNIEQVQPDMLCVHGYKWLLSPNGAGFVYVRPELRTRLQPSVVGWRSHRTWRAVDNLHHGVPDFTDAAEKYEGGMLSFALLYAMGASVEMILEIGIQAIEARVMELAVQVRKVLRDAGATVVDYPSPIVTGCFEHVDSSHLAGALRERRVLVAARKGRLRVSPHFYNNEADIEVFARELRAVL